MGGGSLQHGFKHFKLIKKKEGITKRVILKVSHFIFKILMNHRTGLLTIKGRARQAVTWQSLIRNSRGWTSVVVCGGYWLSFSVFHSIRFFLSAVNQLEINHYVYGHTKYYFTFALSTISTEPWGKHPQFYQLSEYLIFFFFCCFLFVHILI